MKGITGLSAKIVSYDSDNTLYEALVGWWFLSFCRCLCGDL